MMYDIMSRMENEDEGVYDNGETISFDFDTIMESVAEWSDDSEIDLGNVDTYWNGIENEDDRAYFNEVLELNLE